MADKRTDDDEPEAVQYRCEPVSRYERQPDHGWVCGSWPRCYHGRLAGLIFGCGGMR